MGFHLINLYSTSDHTDFILDQDAQWKPDHHMVVIDTSIHEREQYRSGLVSWVRVIPAERKIEYTGKAEQATNRLRIELYVETNDDDLRVRIKKGLVGTVTVVSEIGHSVSNGPGKLEDLLIVALTGTKLDEINKKIEENAGKGVNRQLHPTL